MDTLEAERRRDLANALRSDEPGFALLKLGIERDGTPLSEACLVAIENPGKRIPPLASVLNFESLDRLPSEQIGQLVKSNSNPAQWESRFHGPLLGGTLGLVFNESDLAYGFDALSVSTLGSITSTTTAKFLARKVERVSGTVLRSIIIPVLDQSAVTDFTARIVENSRRRGEASPLAESTHKDLPRNSEAAASFLADCLRWCWKAAGVFDLASDSKWYLTPRGYTCVGDLR